MTNTLEQYLPDKENTDEPKKIGLYGGSFNPPHLGHALMVLTVLMTQDLDEVWIIPCGEAPHKNGLEPFDVRKEMCEQTFGHIKDTQVIELENHLPSPSYTVNTLKTIKELRPNYELFFIVGTDVVEEIPEWENAEGITDLARFMVVPRQGYPLMALPGEVGNAKLVKMGIELPELSSTLIRKFRERGLEMDKFVEKNVAETLKSDD